MHSTFTPTSVVVFPTSPGGQRCGPIGLGGFLGGIVRAVVVGSAGVVGKTNVVVVVEAVVVVAIAVVEVDVDCAAAEFFAVASDWPLGALEQAVAPRPNRTNVEAVTSLIFRI